MNNLKRFFALVLCLALVVVCFAGCHKKGEIAVTIGNYSFSSGYYACALVYADMEARAEVESQLSESEETETTTIDYFAQKIDDMDYTAWVEKTALDNLKKIAVTRDLCDKEGVKLDAADEDLAKENVNLAWNSYGYSELMEKNGVSKETFIEYMKDGYLTDGEGGEKEVGADKIEKYLTDNFALVNIINVDFTDYSDDKMEDVTEQFQAYEKDLKNGDRTFEEILLDYTGADEEEHDHGEAEEGEPEDPHAEVLGSEDTDYYSENFEKAKEMEVGEVKLLTLEDKQGLALVVKKDIMEDPYYIDALDSDLRHGVVGDAFEDDIVKLTESVAVNVNTSSTKQFKVKNIKYPESIY